jgi:hypothetical protein
VTPETPFEPESFVPLLERIRDLLLKHDFLEQATVVAGLIDLAHLEDPSFADKLGEEDCGGVRAPSRTSLTLGVPRSQ